MSEDRQLKLGLRLLAELQQLKRQARGLPIDSMRRWELSLQACELSKKIRQLKQGVVT